MNKGAGRRLVSIGEDPAPRETLELLLTDQGYAVQSFPSYSAALDRRALGSCDAVLLRLGANSGEVGSLVEELVSQCEPAPLLVLGVRHLNEAFSALHAGAVDLFPERLNIQRFLARLENHLESVSTAETQKRAPSNPGRKPVKADSEDLGFFARLDLGMETHSQTGPTKDRNTQGLRLIGRRKPGKLRPVGSSGTFRAFMERLDSAITFKRSLLLRGPKGSEFKVILRYLKGKMQVPLHSVLEWNGANLKEDDFMVLKDPQFEDPDFSPFLIVWSADEVSKAYQKRLVELANGTGEFERTGSARIVFVSEKDLDAAFEAGQLIDSFYMLATLKEILIPRLEDRLEDVEALSWELLNSLAEIPEEIEDKALPSVVMEAILEMDWSGNFAQLEAFWKEVVKREPELPLTCNFLAEVEEALEEAQT